MSDYEPKRGERVLVGGTVCGDKEMIVPKGSPKRWPVAIDGEIRSPRLDDIHPHPGVPVADLLEELELRDALWDRKYTTDRSERLKAEARVEELRAAREADKEPKLEEGQEVWMQGTVEYVGDDFVLVQSLSGFSNMTVHPDDISMEKP